LKKLLYGLSLFALLLIVAAVFAANSSFVIKKAAEQFAPEYDISYDDISGNMLTGVKIEGLRYADKPLVKSIKFTWNPARLLDKSISIYEIEIQEGNVDVIKSLIASFETNASSSSDPFDFSVTVEKGYVTLTPFEEQGVRVEKLLLDAGGIKYTSDALDVKYLSLEIDSNLTNIDLKGGLIEDEVHLEYLSLGKIDTLAIQKLFLNYQYNSSKISSTDHDETNPFMPKYITIKILQGSILPVVYDPLHIDHFVLNGGDIVFDIQKRMAEKGKVELNVRTNLSNAGYRGEIKNNHLIGKILLTPNKRLFELYKLPLRKEAIGDIIIDLDVSKEDVIADVQAKAKHLFVSEKGEYEVDIDSLLSHVVYTVDTNKLQVDTKAVVTTPHARDISIVNAFLMDKNITYRGEIKAKELAGIDEKFTKPFKNLDIKYSGDMKSIKIRMTSDMFKGSFYSSDFKKGDIHLESTKEILVGGMVDLPAELNGSKVNLLVDAPIDFDNNVSFQAKILLTSNVANIDADVLYGKKIQIKALTQLAEDSLLKSFNEKLKWDRLSPTLTDIELSDNTLKVKLEAAELKVHAEYHLSSKKLDGSMRLGNMFANIDLNEEKLFRVNTKVGSIQSLIKSLQSFYTLRADEIPVVDGEAELSVVAKDFSKFDVILKSPQLTYSPDHKTKHIVTDVNIATSIESTKIVLKNYKLTYDKQMFFSTKPSVLHLKDDTITISQFWLNDQLKGEGNYSLKTWQGYFKADASKLHVAHEFVDLDSEVHISMVLDGNETSIDGNIVLLGGNVHYDLRQKTFATDDDIVIVQDIKKKKAGPFMDNLSASIKIETKNPLVYKQNDTNIEAKVYLKISKAKHAPLTVNGSIEFAKGGTYIFGDKTFVLNKSYIYFIGDVNKPLVEASISHKSSKHLITASITGTLEIPNITFSSTPALSREQILSVILFGSAEGTGVSSGDEMMKMMGGAMAKSVLSNIGVQLDHFVVGDSVEVGKKLTDDITIIYVRDEVAGVKLKYEHNKRTESVIEMNEESQSFDIIYSKDF